MEKYSICFENSQFKSKPMKIMKQNKSGNVASNPEVAPINEEKIREITTGI